MTLDDSGQPFGHPPIGSWLTLTDAAARSGHSREALRQRIRRGNLRARKGNDGQLRVQARDLADLPTPDVSADDPGQTPDAYVDAITYATLDVLVATVADLRTDLGRMRTALDKALDDRLIDCGRAERAEAQMAAEARRADAAEARLVAAEAALTEARLPWIVRVVRAIRLITPVAPVRSAPKETRPAPPAVEPVQLSSCNRAGDGQ